jgi:hypothetical protein
MSIEELTELFEQSKNCLNKSNFQQAVNLLEKCIENNPEKLLSLIEEGYEIEIDLWYRDNNFFLGHDFPEYEIEESYLENSEFWIHCKDADTLEFMNQKKKHLNYIHYQNFMVILINLIINIMIKKNIFILDKVLLQVHL